MLMASEAQLVDNGAIKYVPAQCIFVLTALSWMSQVHVKCHPLKCFIFEGYRQHMETFGLEFGRERFRAVTRYE